MIYTQGIIFRSSILVDLFVNENTFLIESRRIFDSSNVANPLPVFGEGDCQRGLK